MLKIIWYECYFAPESIHKPCRQSVPEHAEIMMLKECYADLRLHIIPLNVLYPSSSL